MVLCALALPWLIVTFRRPGNTGLFMYFYAVIAQRISGIHIHGCGREHCSARDPAGPG